MVRYKCVVIEDEPLAAEILTDYISQVPFLELRQVYSDAITALEFLKSEKAEKKYTFEPLLEKHQKEELRRDAQRLLEMEEQLAQLQKMRELKRKRDRDRRKKKLEFMSACCIQRCFRAYLQYKVDHSADLIVSFLRFCLSTSFTSFINHLLICCVLSLSTTGLWQHDRLCQQRAGRAK